MPASLLKESKVLLRQGGRSGTSQTAYDPKRTFPRVRPQSSRESRLSIRAGKAGDEGGLNARKGAVNREAAGLDKREGTADPEGSRAGKDPPDT